jgi:hypothetical protein
LDRGLAQQDDSLVLIGIDHPIINRLCAQWRDAAPETLGAAAHIGLAVPAVLSIWLVQAFGSGPDTGTHLLAIAVDQQGKRIPALEKQYRDCCRAATGKPQFDPAERSRLLHEHIEPTLQRELDFRGIARPESGFSSELLAWLDVS